MYYPTVYLCPVHSSPQIATILLNNINRELFITETDRVICEVGGIVTHNVDCLRFLRG